MAHRVLIIDDSAIALEMLSAALRESGFEPVGATDLASLSRVLQQGPYLAGVLDLQMPETFGDDLLEFLREVRGVRVPLILYSDVGEDVLAARAKAVGADGYVNKGGGLSKLVQMLNEIGQKTASAAPAPAPEAVAAVAVPAPAAAGQAASVPSGRRVMIVDDSEMTAKLIEAELQGKGFEIILADSVDKATRLILKKQTRPELIMLDVNMPNVDGAHFCRFIKGNSLFRGIKVVLCSGMEVEKLKATAAECGADGFVPKDSFLSKWVLDQIQDEKKK